ncbi:hypothetical protein EVA_09354 [gut metagenome]|uniref:Uncharacterized protein n=1 Tax=gut metagenome TaxID=749906 RepID=J9GKD4_9ZZZZ
MILFLLKQAFGDEDGHCHVLMAGLFKAGVQNVLDVFPNGIAIGAKNHAAFNGGVVHQLCFQAHVSVPLGKVFIDGGNGFHKFLFIAH